MQAAPNQAQFILNLPMEHQPGSHFKYNSGACQLLTAIIQNATGQNAYNFAFEELFTPLFIGSVYWSMDKQGINYGGFLMYTAPRSMAKLGFLYLNSGFWNDQQILPNVWVENSTTAYIQTPYYSTDYGYLWRLDRDGDYYHAWGS